jgi:hypothetical protein
MAKYGKNNYFDGVVLPEPKEEALRRMAKGVDASKGYLTTNAAGVLFEGPRTFVCHFKYEAGIRLQGIAGFTVPIMALEIAPSTNLLRFYCGTTSATAPIVLGNSYQAVISYDGTTAVCYLNGSEAARFTVEGYAVTNVFRIGNPSYPPVGPVYSSSHFNYALSAGEVSALWNNGDPMGYVVPKAMRELLSVNLIGSNSFTWDGSDSPYYYNISGNPITIGKYYKINVTVSDYQSGYPRIFAGISYPIPAQNGTFDIVVYNERYVNNFPIYSGSDGDPNRHLTITVNSITSVGLLAEYLPQNLIPTTEGSVVQWLDSAPQLPEANGILPPLDASVGGYDLAAIGNPKIII